MQVNPKLIGLGALGALGIVGAVAWALSDDDAPERADQPVGSYAASLVRDFDRINRRGNFNGAVDIASEGVRIVHDHTTSYSTSGSRPSSDMTGLPTGSKQGGRHTSVYDAEFDGRALLRAADADGIADGTVTTKELQDWLTATYDASGDGTLQLTEQDRLEADHATAFTPKEIRR